MAVRTAAIVNLIVFAGSAWAADCWPSTQVIPLPKVDITRVATDFCTPSPIDNNHKIYDIGGSEFQVNVNDSGTSWPHCADAIDNILSLCGPGGGVWHLYSELYTVNKT